MTDKETSGIKEEPKWVGDYNKANPDISHNRMKEILSTSKTVTKEEIERILSTTKYFTVDELIAKALSDYKQAMKKEIEAEMKNQWKENMKADKTDNERAEKLKKDITLYKAGLELPINQTRHKQLSLKGFIKEAKLELSKLTKPY